MYSSLDPQLETSFQNLRHRQEASKIRIGYVSSNIPARRRRIVDPRFVSSVPLVASVGARATGHKSPSLRLTVQDYYLRRDYCRALPREGVRICRDSWNSVIQPAEATRSRQAGSGSSNGGLAPIWGGRSASLSLQGCYIQTTCSSASDVEVQLGGREETTEGFCLPLNYRYREYELWFKVGAAHG